MSEHTIHIIGDGHDEAATVIATFRDRMCHVSLRHCDRHIEAVAFDFFEAFSEVRLQLESEHLTPVCYGSSLNVFPSGMCRDMGSGLSAYRLTLGRKPSGDDIVGIFDSGPDVIPVSVADQKKHFWRWLRSTSSFRYVLLSISRLLFDRGSTNDTVA